MPHIVTTLPESCIVSKHGHELLGIVTGDPKHVLERHEPILASLVIATYRRQIVFGYNKDKEYWEAPAGRIEKGESVEECARRELLEESCQEADGLEFLGLAHIKRPSGKEKYTAVFFTRLKELAAFHDNAEWDDIKLWSLSSGIEDSNAVDCEIAATFLKRRKSLRAKLERIYRLIRGLITLMCPLERLDHMHDSDA